MMRILIGVVMLAACGGMSAGNDAHGGGGGGGTVDAKPGTSEDVTCQTHTQSVTGSDGTVTSNDYKFAIIDDVNAGDTFAVEMCGGVSTSTTNASTTSGPAIGTFAIAPACPAGSTCADSGASFPAGDACDWSTDGTFIGGKLVVYCGYSYTQTRASSTTAGSLSYATIRVHH